MQYVVLDLREHLMRGALSSDLLYRTQRDIRLKDNISVFQERQRISSERLTISTTVVGNNQVRCYVVGPSASLARVHICTCDL